MTNQVQKLFKANKTTQRDQKQERGACLEASRRLKSWDGERADNWSRMVVAAPLFKPLA